MSVLKIADCHHRTKVHKINQCLSTQRLSISVKLTAMFVNEVLVAIYIILCDHIGAVSSFHYFKNPLGRVINKMKTTEQFRPLFNDLHQRLTTE